MRTKIINLLSPPIDINLVNGLIDSFIKVKEYYNFKFQEAILYAGHFCEFSWKIINFNATGTILKKITSKKKIIEEIEKLTSLTDQERIIIPRITSVAYDIRNRKRSGHATDILPTKNDSYLVHRICSYVLIEFLLLYSNKKIDEIRGMLEKLIIRKAPIVEEIDGYFFGNNKTTLTDLVLYIIYVHEEGTLKRADILNLIPTHDRSTIQVIISKLKKDGKIFENPENTVFLRKKGLEFVENLILKSFP